MANINYEMEWNPEDIQRFVELTKRVYSRGVELMAQEVWGNIGREAPTDHGKLAGSFMIEAIDDYTWRIYSNVLYALWVHEGTGVYGPRGQPIVPINANTLVFEWQGRTWFLKSVKGQQPNPYADRAMDSASARTQEFIERALNEVEAVA